MLILFERLLQGAIYIRKTLYSAAISSFLTYDLDQLAMLTSASCPMHLNLIDSQIVATIGGNQRVLFEYPEKTEQIFLSSSKANDRKLSTVDVKSPADIALNLKSAKAVTKYIPLDITETQGSNNWCTAYCLATIIRTQTTFYTTALGIMTIALGANPSTSSASPWASDNGATMTSISGQYSLSPTVLTTTTSNSTLVNALNSDHLCVVAMHATAGNHSVVLRGFSSYGAWGIWNPWFDQYEYYTIDGTYVPMGYNSSNYSYTPYMHAYNF